LTKLPGFGLKDRIAEMIRIDGPMPVSLYMLTCLHDPRDGYYATRAGFNADFTTAPETSQVFGELLGLWAAHEWIALGSPRKFWFVELGPGRGAMMADMLRAASSVTGFREAAQIALIEASPALREQQKATLQGETVTHFPSLGDVPHGSALIIANEFLDCFPVRQFVRDGNAWRERRIGLDNSGEMIFGVGPLVELPPNAIPVGDNFEFAPGFETLVDLIAQRFRTDAGRALIIDYGPDDRSPGDTLRAYQAGQQISPLAAPGQSDLTADVDFPRLARLAQARELAVHGPLAQGYFLTRLGIRERAMSLAKANPARAGEIAAAMQKLVQPNQMGARFKAICLSPSGAEPPPGF
jgi:NADH dehydrogenase [ubiquinone] 1 alpha subcomplex assembly factor 7